MSKATPAGRISAWYKANGWTRFQFQQKAWQAYARGESGLIHSPTGSGKTLAAWLGPVRAAMDEARSGAPPVRALRVLWITPLRALATDTCRALTAAVDALDVPWEVDVRTGDTPSSRRTRQRKKPPHALITTPESLSLLLSYSDAEQYFRHLDAVIVDEWHELIGNKRGVQLQLGLSQLRVWRSELRVWGLSATLGNLDTALAALLAPGQSGVRIAGNQTRKIRIRSLIPASMSAFPWAGHLGLSLLDDVIAALESSPSTLLFANTRAQCEQWFEALMRARPDWIGQVAIHHGSIDHDVRLRVEQALRDGQMRCVVCTSSLDLGVDFSPVEQVIQVGSPKGVARLLQRAGRSGHRPGAASDVLCVPGHAFELVEFAAARLAAERGQIEGRSPPVLCLDVLAQHLVTLALGQGFRAEATLAAVRATHAFATLSDEDWQWTLDFITRGGQALQGYPQYHRVAVDDDGVYRVTSRRIATQHRMGIGTITSDTAMRVAWLKGGTIGYIEESFLTRLKKTDRFLFAGRLLKLVTIKDMTAYVRIAKPGKRTVPRWQGGRMPLSAELSDTVLELLSGSQPELPEMQAVSDMLAIQSRWSRRPSPDELLVEGIGTRGGFSLFIYPYAGRLVHEGLAALVAWRLTQRIAVTFKLSVNDYGFELLSHRRPDLSDSDLAQALSPDRLAEDLVQCLNTSELARRQFRDIARIAGLVFTGYPGKGKSTRQVQASSGLIFDVLKDYDSENRLLAQAEREVLTQSLEFRRLEATLSRLADRQLHVVYPERVTPLSFPLWAERVAAQTVSSESFSERVQRMAESLSAYASRG
ncbi:MAG: ligase-associated DNA damage response DEXH box helicase [Pseudomonadota bacterium]